MNMVVEDMKGKGVSPLYLITDHTCFYERYGLEFLCMVQGEGEEEMTRMYFFMCSLFGQETVMNIAVYMGQCMLFALVAELSVLVYYSREELTQKQWWIRTILH